MNTTTVIQLGDHHKYLVHTR